jgi:preprotein translocase subunit SecE
VGSIPTWPASSQGDAVLRGGVLALRRRSVVADKDEKKQQSKEPKAPNAIQRFWRETIGELRKVTWPTWKEAWNLTKIVLIVLVVMSSFLGLLDIIFTWLVGRLIA